MRIPVCSKQGAICKIASFHCNNTQFTKLLFPNFIVVVLILKKYKLNEVHFEHIIFTGTRNRLISKSALLILKYASGAGAKAVISTCKSS